MKKFIIAIAAVVLVATVSNSFAQNWGLWDADRSWIGLNQNSTTNYWSVWNTTTGTFDNTALGTYSNTSTLNISAYDIKVWKDTANGGDVTGGTFYWTVYSGARPGTPSFSSISLGFIENISTNGSVVNQKWGFSGGTTSILANPNVSFSGNNNYTFEFYVQVNGGNNPAGSLYDNNGGAADNYTATFSTIPEPSTYALLALSAAGFGGYVIRRRRR